MEGLCDCGKEAVWLYMPSYEGTQRNDFYCDDCVARGCSCNMEPVDGDTSNQNPLNWVERLDEQGRKYPCCEYSYIGELK